MRIKGLGLPYMGSKRKLAYKIVNKILKDNPQTKYIYDLFGGGGAISFEALQRKDIKQVYYNEFNRGVVELLRDLKENGFTDKYLQWVDRETFKKHKNNNDWFGGLCKVVWSFGNNQKGYLFGKEVEPVKKLAHDFIVYRNMNAKKELEKILDIKIPEFGIGLFDYDLHKARREFARFVINNKNKRMELQQLEQLEQLQQLEQLEQLQQLELSSKSYENVKITTPINETIIYLDPPYKDTGKYQKDIDHDKLKEYIHKSPYKIYLSSYENVYDMVEVASFEHRSSLSATANNKVIERLFCNKEKQ